MSTKAIFANEYYNDPWLLVKGWQVKKKPEGGLKFTSNLFTDFWGARNLQAKVDNNGTITTLSPSFFDRLKKYNCLSQNQNLISAHRRLKELEVQLQNPLSHELQTLRNEIHNVGHDGAATFQRNLKALENDFKKTNEKNCLVRTLIKVIDFIRKSCNYPPLEFYHFSPLNLKLFQDQAIAPALELTDSDRLRCKWFPVIQNNSLFPIPPELNQENLQRLELGLLEGIAFTIDQKKLYLSYDTAKEEFLISYFLEPSSSLILNIVEKKIDGSTISHPLCGLPHKSHQRGIFRERLTFTVYAVPMRVNNEYIIPLSQGNLSLKFYRRR